MPEKLNNFKKPVTKFLEIDILSNDKFNQTCSPSDFRFIKSTEHDSIDKSNLILALHNQTSTSPLNMIKMQNSVTPKASNTMFQPKII